MLERVVDYSASYPKSKPTSQTPSSETRQPHSWTICHPRITSSQKSSSVLLSVLSESEFLSLVGMRPYKGCPRNRAISLRRTLCRICSRLRLNENFIGFLFSAASDIIEPLVNKPQRLINSVKVLPKLNEEYKIALSIYVTEA